MKSSTVVYSTQDVESDISETGACFCWNGHFIINFFLKITFWKHFMKMFSMNTWQMFDPKLTLCDFTNHIYYVIYEI